MVLKPIYWILIGGFMKKNYNGEAIKLIKILGNNVQKIRISKNISIKEMSEKTGIREKYLKKIEKGEAIGITTSKIFLIADALSVKVSLLVKE